MKRASEELLERIEELRNRKDLSGYAGNVNELYESYISDFQAKCIISDLERLEDKTIKENYSVKKENEFKKNMTVAHRVLGEGKITAAKGSVVTVKFDTKVSKFDATVLKAWLVKEE